MKNIIIIFLSVFLFGTTTQLTAQSKKMDKFTVEVDGLGCPFCAYGLEKKFKEFKGIKKVKIEMETGVMDFEYPTDKELSIELVEEQVKKAGYTPVSVSIARTDDNQETTKKDNADVDEEGNLKSMEFFVAGNCGMCKSRIENAARKIDGVQSAEWDKETRQLRVKLSEDIAQSDVEAAVAKAGHDTKNAKTDKATYSGLPGCCQYEREQ